MKYGYKEIRTIDPVKLMKLCYNKQWFTKGTNDEYFQLAKYGFAQVEITTDELVEMAEMILEHSDTDYEITSIMYELNLCCDTYFEEI